MSENGRNQGDLQGQNRALLLRLIHRLPGCTRAELARKTGLTKAAVTILTQQLLNAGMIRETGRVDGRGGRRAIGLEICREKYLCIGLRLTRRHVRGGLFDLGGECYDAQSVRIAPGTSARDTLALMAGLIKQLLESAAGRQVIGVGIASSGPILTQEGRIAFMSAFPGWEDISLQEELAAQFHLPVLLEHDGLCYALAQWWSRPADAEYKMLLCVLVGQGVGAGMVANGVPLRGALGCAGEMGHMSLNPLGPECPCGNRGCLEQYVSVVALERAFAQALAAHPEHPSHGRAPAAAEIMAQARAGAPLAAETVRTLARYLAYGMVNAVNLLNPDCIVITDEFAACDALVRDEVDAVLRARLSPRIYQGLTLIVRPDSPLQAMQAAAALILDKFLQEPGFALEPMKGA